MPALRKQMLSAVEGWQVHQSFVGCAACVGPVASFLPR